MTKKAHLESEARERLPALTCTNCGAYVGDPAPSEATYGACVACLSGEDPEVPEIIGVKHDDLLELQRLVDQAQDRVVYGEREDVDWTLSTIMQFVERLSLGIKP